MLSNYDEGRKAMRLAWLAAEERKKNNGLEPSKSWNEIELKVRKTKEDIAYLTTYVGTGHTSPQIFPGDFKELSSRIFIGTIF